MCLDFVEISDSDKWFGWHLTVNDELKLAELIALVALAQFRHVEKILDKTSNKKNVRLYNEFENARELLSAVKGNFIQRDGWMFQVIAWIAAHIKKENDIIKTPQMAKTESGPDGIILELREIKNARIVICEEKATTDPKKLINGVWKQITKYDNKNSYLREKLTVMLNSSRRFDEYEIDDIIESTLWKNERAYRVSITLDESQSNDVYRQELFKNYSVYIKGDMSCRRAETFQTSDLRKWLSTLANNAINKVNEMESLCMTIRPHH